MKKRHEIRVGLAHVKEQWNSSFLFSFSRSRSGSRNSFGGIRRRTIKPSFSKPTGGRAMYPPRTLQDQRLQLLCTVFVDCRQQTCAASQGGALQDSSGKYATSQERLRIHLTKCGAHSPSYEMSKSMRLDRNVSSRQLFRAISVAQTSRPIIDAAACEFEEKAYQAHVAYV